MVMEGVESEVSVTEGLPFRPGSLLRFPKAMHDRFAIVGKISGHDRCRVFFCHAGMRAAFTLSTLCWMVECGAAVVDVY